MHSSDKGENVDENKGRKLQLNTIEKRIQKRE